MTREYIESFRQAQRLRRRTPAQAASRVAPLIPVALVLAAAAVALLVALRTPLAWSLDVGAPDDGRFVSEMLERERDHTNGATFRWTEPLAHLWLHGTEFGDFALDLHIYNDPALAGNRELRLERGGRALGSLRLAEGWRVYRVLLPGSAGDAGLGTPPLELATAPIHTPGDSLERGVPLDWVHVRLLGRAAPPWRALLLAWGLVALAGWLWQLDRVLFVRQAATRGMRVAVLVAVVAAGLVAWALVDPRALAWAIPPMPWAFGLATVLLVAGALAPLRARVQSRPLALAAIALLVAGQALLATQAAVALGAGLALLALALLPAETRDPRPENDAHPLTPSPPHPLIALGLLLLIALGLRFYRLGELPYGLWRDEGRHGLEALRMLGDPSYRPAYIRGGVDLPGLGLYPFALALRIWGIHVWAMRTVTALAGALATLPLYALTRRLYGSGIGLLAAALLAFSHWDVTISRFSFPTIFDPLLQLTALWLLMVGLDRILYGGPSDDRRPTTDDRRPTTTLGSDRALYSGPFDDRRPTTDDRRPLYAGPSVAASSTENRELGMGTRRVNREPTDHRPRTRDHGPRTTLFFALCSLFFAGVCLGLAVQTYHTGRLGLATVGLLALLLLLRARARWRGWLLGVAVLGIGFLLAASPLLGYALSNPGSFNQRVGAVFLLSDESTDKGAPLTKLDDSLGRHLLMFNVRGDSNGRHVAPNRPMLDAVTGLGLLAGIAAVLRRRRDWRSLFLLGALAIGLLPSLLSIESPHGMRSIDALPFACVIAALGLAQLWRLITWESPSSAMRRVVVRGAAGLALGLALILNAWTYFGIMPADPLVWTSFYPYHTRIGAYIRTLADEHGPQAVRQIYVPEQLADNPVFEYLTYALPVQTFDGRHLSAPAPAGALFVFPNTNSGQEARALLEQSGLDLVTVASGPLLPDGVTASFVVYRH